MKELLELIKVYENSTNRDCVGIKLFSDGSGDIEEFEEHIYTFQTIEELFIFLKK